MTKDLIEAELPPLPEPCYPVGTGNVLVAYSRAQMREYGLASRLAAPPSDPGWVRLMDSDWVNIVNAPAVLDPYKDTEEAVREAVKLTEARLRELNSGIVAAATPSTPTLTDKPATAILQAVSRGWCHAKNAHKRMDADLAIAIAAEVNALFTDRATKAIASPASPTGLDEAAIRAAMRRAFALGERHWQQADSEYHSENRKAAGTRAKFDALVNETCAAASPSIRGESGGGVAHSTDKEQQ